MPLYNLSGAQYQGIVEYFNKHSAGGVIGRNELKAVLSTKCGANVTSQVLTEMIDMISVDGNGIGLQAFVDYCAVYTSLRNQDQEYADAFRIYDRSGTGQLRRDDVKYIMGKLGVAEFNADALMDKVDLDGNGVIDFEEFKKMMEMKL